MSADIVTVIMVIIHILQNEHVAALTCKVFRILHSSSRFHGIILYDITILSCVTILFTKKNNSFTSHTSTNQERQRVRILASEADIELRS